MEVEHNTPAEDSKPALPEDSAWMTEANKIDVTKIEEHAGIPPLIKPSDGHWTNEYKTMEMREVESAALNDSLKISKGNIIKAESIPNIDGIVLTTDAGHQQYLSRQEALQRVQAVYEMICRETGSASREQLDMWIELCHMVFKAARVNGESRGCQYDIRAVKRFEHTLLRMKNIVSKRPDNINPNGSNQGWRDDLRGEANWIPKA